MMYGFGDDQNPYTESVDFLEDIVIEFITEVVSFSTFNFLSIHVEVIGKVFVEVRGKYDLFRIADIESWYYDAGTDPFSKSNYQ